MLGTFMENMGVTSNFIEIWLYRGCSSFISKKPHATWRFRTPKQALRK
jgi:hypothetical protein